MNAALLLFVISASSAAAAEALPAADGFRESGLASWYGSECSRTAGGKRYLPGALTAAHRSLPLGTLVEVQNLANGRTVTVRINDRGPFCKKRIIDLSKAAAQKLEMIASGTARVELVVLK
jgi:rare lipoprotein A